MGLDRRRLISVAGAFLAAPSLARAASGERDLPSPDFSASAIDNPTFIAGLRPWREGSFRLEPEVIGSKFVVHNYGHGGAGITMSWGCAAEVRRIVAARRIAMTNRKVAVLGSGVMGLTAATLLADLGLDVSIYAADFPPNTTSNKAGGQWAPSFVQHADETRFRAILKAAYAGHLSRGPGYGVLARDNYTFAPSDDLGYAALSGAAPAEALERLPFANMTHAGFRYPTLLVEPPVLLARLHRELKARGVAMRTMRFAGPDSVAALGEGVVVNCLGLGSGQVWTDPALRGLKGQLALLRPQPALKYLYSGVGYMFPRQDHLVLGGSFQGGAAAADDAPDPAMGRLIIKVIRAVFEGALPLPRWLPGRDTA